MSAKDAREVAATASPPVTWVGHGPSSLPGQTWAAGGVPPGLVEVLPTQVRRPWRSSLRTAFQAGLALAVLWPIIVTTLGLPDWAWVGLSVAGASAVTRVMALPQVEVWLRTFLPFLAAAPKASDQ